MATSKNKVVFEGDVSDLIKALNLSQKQAEDLAKALENTGDAAGDAARETEKAGNKMTKALTWTMAKVQLLTSLVGGALKGAFRTLISAIDFSAVWEALGFTQDQLEEFKNKAKDVLGKIVGGVIGVGNALLQYLLIPIKNAITAFNTLGNVIKDIFSGNWEALKTDAYNGAKEIAESIKKGFSFGANFNTGMDIGEGFMKRYFEAAEINKKKDSKVSETGKTPKESTKEQSPEQNFNEWLSNHQVEGMMSRDEKMAALRDIINDEKQSFEERKQAYLEYERFLKEIQKEEEKRQQEELKAQQEANKKKEEEEERHRKEMADKQKTIADLQDETVKSMISATKQLGSLTGNKVISIAGIIAEAVANVIKGYAKASSESASFGPYGWAAFSVAGLAQVSSMIAQIHSLSGYADGGIIGGNSYVGDKMLARVNSGEMILNQGQQANLFDMINAGGIGGGNVQFHISGSDLVGVLQNYNKKTGRVM